jgi:DNA-binding CsgD family transcriptional regulator
MRQPIKRMFELGNHFPQFATNICLIRRAGLWWRARALRTSWPWASDGAELAVGARVGEAAPLDPQLTVRRVSGAYPELDALLIARAPRLDLPALGRFGLTKRQAEVLALATGGLSAQQIADALVLSRRTVEKHFEAIYNHLGVNSLAQAIALAVGALNAARLGRTGRQPEIVCSQIFLPPNYRWYPR